MRSSLATLGLSLVTAIMLGAGGPMGTIPVDNFDDGNSDGWSKNDLTGGRGTFEVRSGSYFLETTEPIAVLDPSVGTLDSDWEPSEDEPTFANGTMRGTVRANTDGTTVGFLVRENHETETDYGFYGSTSFGTFYIEQYDLFGTPDAPQTIIAMADPDEFPFEVGVTYVLEASVINHKLTLKAWRADGPEPNRPVLTLHDKKFGPGAGSGLGVIAFFDPAPLLAAGVEAVVVSATVDDLTFTPARKVKDGE